MPTLGCQGLLNAPCASRQAFRNSKPARCARLRCSALHSQGQQQQRQQQQQQQQQQQEQRQEHSCTSRRAALALLSAAAVSLTVQQPRAWAEQVEAAQAAPQRSTATSLPGTQLSAEGVTTLVTTEQALASMTPTDKQVYTLNRRVQTQNRAPEDFPGFVRQGFDIKVVGDGYQVDGNGLIYKDYKVGTGETPTDGNQVVFDYVAYNESGALIDSTYRLGRPGETRLGIGGLIPGFEQGIKSMRVGGKRRIVVPPELGPPVGPSTFFSAKQCEVFDVELRALRTCTRRQVMMFSDVKCE